MPDHGIARRLSYHNNIIPDQTKAVKLNEYKLVLPSDKPSDRYSYIPV